jgi:SNF2 family DNA or RNA helicase
MEDINTINYFDILPNEVIVRILFFTRSRHFLRYISTVNKKFYNLIKNHLKPLTLNPEPCFNLHTYERECVSHVLNVEKTRKGGCLSIPMGSGKSTISIYLSLIVNSNTRINPTCSLILCNNRLEIDSLINNASLMFLNCKILNLSRSFSGDLDSIGDYDVVITTYNLIKLVYFANNFYTNKLTMLVFTYKWNRILFNDIYKVKNRMIVGLNALRANYKWVFAGILSDVNQTFIDKMHKVLNISESITAENNA